MQKETQRLFSLAAIVVAAVLFGMVIAGGLDMTPRAVADRSESNASSAPAAVASTQSGTFAAPDFASLAERVVPSVVSVYSKEIQQPGERGREMPMDPFHFFFGPRGGDQGDQEPTVRQSAGSGFFISSSGEVLTNNHVVEGADELEIELDDGTRYQVTVVGRDPATDVALVKVVKPDREFPVLPLGDSSATRVGEWVMAVGNPLNMDHTVTVGVVSAKGRRLGLSTDSSFENYIQTDAAINFGNSGGPLVNLRGEAIGMNTAINARGQNLGFAVPSNIAKSVLPQLRERGKVVRGYLGVSVAAVDQKKQEAFGLPNRDGAFVESVLPGHAAEKAGIQKGDVIVSVDGVKVGETRDLIDYVSSKAPDSKVSIVVLRDGKQKTLTATLEQRETEGDTESEQGQQEGIGDAAERVGISVMELTPRLREMYRVGDDISGVLITQVKAVSAAADEGLLRGDVITEAGGEPVHTPEQLFAQINKVVKGEYLKLYVYRPRADSSFFALLKLDK